MKKVKGSRKKEKKHPHTHRQQYGDHQRERGGEVEDGKGGINSSGRRLDLGW